MDVEIMLPVRIRLRGVSGVDQGQDYARHLIEKGAEILPAGVTLLGVECGAVDYAIELEGLS